MTLRTGAILAGLTALALACGAPSAPGAPTSPADASDADAFEVSAGSRYLLQRSTGLYDESGRRVATAGATGLKDLLVIDLTQPSFLASDDTHTARVVLPAGERRFTVRIVAEGVNVARIVGDHAIVADAKEPTRQRLIDASGAEIPVPGLLWRDGTLFAEDWAWPEYWWRDVPTDRAVGVNHGPPGGERYGVVRADGTFLAEPRDPAEVDFFVSHTAPDRLLCGTYTEDDVVYCLGPEPLNQRLVVDRNGSIAGVLPSGDHAGVIPWLDPSLAGCRTLADGLGDLRFHEGRAATWAKDPANPTVLLSGYLDRAGAFAVRPEPCTAAVPSGPFHDHRAFQCVGDGIWLIDESGAHLAGPYLPWSPRREDGPSAYPEGLFFADGLAAVPVAGGWSYIDLDGRVAIDGPFAKAYPFRHGFARVSDGSRAWVIDHSGRPALEP